jgi:hypothetical protein
MPWYRHTRGTLRCQKMEMAFSVKSGLLAKRRVQKADSTLRSSRAVPHPSTNRALRRLTSEVRRDPVHSTRYGRQRALSLCCTVIENGYGRESVSASPPPCPPSRPSPLLASFPHYPEGPVQKADSTLRSSRAVPHPSTNRALRRLTSEVRRDPVHSTRYGRQRALSLHCRVKQMDKQRCRFCLLETTGRPPGDHRETAGRPPGDRQETAGRPPGDRRETAGRPPGDRRGPVSRRRQDCRGRQPCCPRRKGLVRRVRRHWRAHGTGESRSPGEEYRPTL